jgi:hypothetical protein
MFQSYIKRESERVIMIRGVNFMIKNLMFNIIMM